MKGIQTGSAPCSCGRSIHETRLIAITGGPGAGKTAVLEMALRSMCLHIAVLPEAASVVFGGGFPRHNSEVGHRAAQRAIFHIQREMESVVVGEGHAAVALCDRGTLDGAAYWSGSVDGYCEEFGTSLDAEYNRYAAVVHLQTPAANQGYNHTNALRIETPSEAMVLNDRILEVWSTHPRRFIIHSNQDFMKKALDALTQVRTLLPECCAHHKLPGAPE